MGPGQTFPPLSILSLRSGSAWEECRKGAVGRGGSELSDTPLFPGPHLPGPQGAVGEEGWGKPELARGKRPDQQRGSPTEGGRGGIGKGCARSYLLRCLLAGGRWGSQENRGSPLSSIQDSPQLLG